MPPRLVSGGSRVPHDEQIEEPFSDVVSVAYTHFPTNHARNDYEELEARTVTTSNNRTTPRPCCITQDNDPMVEYTGKWLLNGTSFKTTHSTTSKGAKVNFEFRGVRITVVGTVAMSNSTKLPPRARYTIDSRRMADTFVPMANTAIEGQAFFRSDALDGSKQHKLTIEITRADDVPYILQHFWVQPFLRNQDNQGNRNPSAQTKSGAAANGVTSQARAGASASVTPSPANTSLPWKDDPQSSSTLTLRILSGVLGALIAVILVGVLVFFLRRRRTDLTRRNFFTKISNWRRRSPPPLPPSPPPPAPHTDTDTSRYSSFTGTNTIQQNEPSFIMRGSSAFTFTATEGPPSSLRQSIANPGLSTLSPVYPFSRYRP